MSGRDFKSFLASHHSAIGQPDNRLMTRFMSGQRPLYREVDYEKLNALTQVKRSSGEQTLKKIEKLTRKNEQCKEQQLLSQHKRIWENELHRLAEEQVKIENEINLLQQQQQQTTYTQRTTRDVNQVFEDILEYETSLNKRLPDFIERTVEPVQNLREDIHYYIEQHRSELIMGVDSGSGSIVNVLQSVKEQQHAIMAQLEEEAARVEDELRQVTSSFNNIHLPEISIGVPKEVQLLECPDEALKELCFKEFDSLDENYVEKLEHLEEKYKSVIQSAPYGGWNEDSHLQFIHVTNQYRDTAKNHRKTYFDCLHRLLKHKPGLQSMKTLKEHEEWWFGYKSFRRRVKDLFHGWKRDRDDLLLQVVALFHEAQSEYATKQNDTVDHMKQKFFCNYLHEKLKEFQEERLQLLQLEEEQRAVREQEMERKQERETLAKEKKREHEKQKLNEYKEKQERDLALIAERNESHLLELQEKRAVQRAHNFERVQYREEKHLEKLTIESLKKHLANIELLERERRLQELRNQVVVLVDDDPTRLYNPTEASKQRVAADYDEEKHVQEPLFKVYTYTVEQKAQDNRVKLENALRRANLHMTDYGRGILSSVAPPSQPRKDMASTVFKQHGDK